MKSLQPEDRSIEQTASEWVVRVADALTPAEAQELKAWLTADPRHAEAYARLGRAWSVFDRAAHKGAAGDIALRAALRQRRRRRRRARFGVAAVAILLLGAIVFWQRHPGLPVDAAAARREAIAQSVRRLPDGSIVELKPGAEIEVRYAAEQRRVALTKGEALFRVAKDATRPFRVKAGTVEVVAVGTAFSVELDPRTVAVVVTEGRVTLTHDAVAIVPEAKPAPVFVDAGNVAVVETGEDVSSTPTVRAISDGEIARRLAWRESLLEFQGTELAEAVALLNRVNRVQVSVADDTIARLRVSGAFRADNPEGFVRIIESTFDLKAERHGADQIVLRRP
jgi:transmembrane sensor